MRPYLRASTPLGIHRATPKLLKLFLGARTHFASPEGLACTRLLGQPVTDPKDCRVTVLGANTGLGHLIYNPSMTRLDVLGDQGPTRGLFRKPTGVALFQDGTAYVTDPDWPRVSGSFGKTTI